MRSAWLAAVLALLISGCCTAPFSAHEVDADAPSRGGPGERAVEVTVVDDQGSTAASLVAWWVRDESAVDDPSRTIVLELVGLRSANGRFVAEVPDDRTIHFTAASDADRTEEWVMDALHPGDGREAVSIHLYNRTIETSFENQWQGAEVATAEAVGTGAGGTVAWHPNLAPFHPDPEINQGYHDRLLGVNGTLSWTNGPASQGSFGVLIAHAEEEEACLWQNQGSEFMPGTHSETFTMPYLHLCSTIIPETWSQEPGDPPVHIGPATGSAVIAPLDGVPYRVDMKAEFQHRKEILDLCEAHEDREVQVVWIDPRTGIMDVIRDAGRGESPVYTPVAGPVAVLGMMAVARALAGRQA